MISTRIVLAFLALGALTSHNALAQCYAKADSCATGYIAVPAPECEPSAHYTCHPDPNYVPPPGKVTGMSVSPNPVAANGSIAIHTTGQNKCKYGFTAKDGNGKILFSTTPLYTAGTGTKTFNLGGLGYVNPGAYQVALVSPAGTNACTQLPPPVTLNLFTPPVALSANMVSVHSKDSAHFNSPFPAGSQLTYAYFSSVWFPGCLVDVTVSGPETLKIPGKLLEFAKTYDLNVSKTGKYTLTYTTSPTATGSQKCTGGPASKSFEIYMAASKFQNLGSTVSEVQPAIKVKP